MTSDWWSWSCTRWGYSPWCDSGVCAADGGSIVDLENVLVVVLLAAGWILLGWVDRNDLLAIGLSRLRARLRRRLPPGYHEWSDDDSLRVGKPDTVLVVRVPLVRQAGGAPVMHVGLTDNGTAFTVDGAPVDLDTFLEAYDEGAGELGAEVFESGRVSALRLGGHR